MHPDRRGRASESYFDVRTPKTQQKYLGVFLNFVLFAVRVHRARGTLPSVWEQLSSVPEEDDLRALALEEFPEFVLRAMLEGGVGGEGTEGADDDRIELHPGQPSVPMPKGSFLA